MSKNERYTFSEEELREQAMKAWELYAEEYRSLLPEYFELLEKKRWLRENQCGCKTLPLRKLPKTTIDGFVKIPFFDIETEEEAISYLDEMAYISLVVLVATIHTSIDGYFYKTIKAKVLDYRYEIARVQNPKKVYGLDPNYATKAGARASKATRIPVTER